MGKRAGVPSNTAYDGQGGMSRQAAPPNIARKVAG